MYLVQSFCESYHTWYVIFKDLRSRVWDQQGFGPGSKPTRDKIDFNKDPNPAPQHCLDQTQK